MWYLSWMGRYLHPTNSHSWDQNAWPSYFRKLNSWLWQLIKTFASPSWKSIIIRSQRASGRKGAALAWTGSLQKFGMWRRQVIQYLMSNQKSRRKMWSWGRSFVSFLIIRKIKWDMNGNKDIQFRKIINDWTFCRMAETTFYIFKKNWGLCLADRLRNVVA